MKIISDQLDYNLSRKLDFQKNLNCLDDGILHSLKILENNKNLTKHLKLLIIDLYSVWSESNEQFLSVSMSKRGYRAKSRYNPNMISSILIQAIKTLKKHDLIELHPGFFDLKKNISRQTRIRAKGLLLEKFQQLKLTFNQLFDVKKREFIYLTKNNELVEYNDNFETHEIREILKNYNLIISKTFFDIPCIKNDYIIRGDNSKIIISDYCKNEYRLFNSFENNYFGSFAGSWWHKLDLSSVEKLCNHMLINDKPTSYIDLENLFPKFLANFFLIPHFEIDFENIKKQSSFVKTNHQLNSMILKGINSKNFEGFFRSITINRKRMGIKEKISKKDILLFIENLQKNNPKVYKLFFLSKYPDWNAFISEIFYKLIKKFGSANVNIPIIKVGDRFFYPSNVEDNVLDYFQETLEKDFKIKKHTLKKSKCFSYEGESKKSIFKSLIKNNLEYSNGFIKRKKSFIFSMKKNNLWINHTMKGD